RSGRTSWRPTSRVHRGRSSPSRCSWSSSAPAPGATTPTAGSSATRSRAATSRRGSPTIPTFVDIFRAQSWQRSLTCATTCGIRKPFSLAPWRMGMERRELLYEGKAKQVYRTSDPDLLIQHFKDDATAFNAKKRGTVQQKGILNNRISEVLFKYLETDGIA